MVHFTSIEQILTYISSNPTFLSGFTSGEGCFGVYLSIDTSLTWGLQPCFEFSITHKNHDLILLEAIKLYFQNKGNVNVRSDDVAVYMVINMVAFFIKPFLLRETWAQTHPRSESSSK